MERSSGAAPPRRSGESGQPESNAEILSVGVEAMNGHVSVISLTGELDLSTIPKLEPRLLEELRNQLAVVLDLTRLSFIDSSGIGVLINAFRAAEDSRMLTVIAPDSQVERVFQLAGIDRALPVFAGRDQALAALNGAGT